MSEVNIDQRTITDQFSKVVIFCIDSEDVVIATANMVDGGEIAVETTRSELLSAVLGACGITRELIRDTLTSIGCAPDAPDDPAEWATWAQPIIRRTDAVCRLLGITEAQA